MYPDDVIEETETEPAIFDEKPAIFDDEGHDESHDPRLGEDFLCFMEELKESGALGDIPSAPFLRGNPMTLPKATVTVDYKGEHEVSEGTAVAWVVADSSGGIATHIRGAGSDVHLAMMLLFLAGHIADQVRAHQGTLDDEPVFDDEPDE